MAKLLREIPELHLASTKNWPLNGYVLAAHQIWPWRRLFGRCNGFLSRKETCAQRFDRTSAFLGA
jgi:hypothetical protein